MKKLLIVILPVCVMALAGCGNADKTLRMVTNADFPPFEYIADNGLIGKYSGIDIAIANEIAEEAKVTLIIDDVPFESVLIQLTTGQADFAAAGLSYNEDRAKIVDFSKPYFSATQYIIVAESTSDIGGVSDLTAKRVGVVDGYSGQDICVNDLKLKNLKNYKKPADAVRALVLGRIDAVVLDSHTANALIKRSSGLKIVTDRAFETEEYVIAVKKGDKKTLDIVNKVIDKLSKNGAINDFVDKYTAESEIE